MLGLECVVGGLELCHEGGNRWIGGLGVGLGLLNWRTAQQLSVHKLSETELDVLLAGIERAEYDQAYQSFLQSVQKEKLVSLAFGCSVPLCEIGRLMIYYERGFATTEQIRLAWPHRNAHQNPLSFVLGRTEKIQLWLAVIYLVLCLVAGLGLVILVLLPPWKILNVSMAGTAACYFAFSWLDFRVHRGLFVASDLSKWERQTAVISDAR